MKQRILSLILLAVLMLLLLPTPESRAKAAAQNTAASDVRIMSANVLAEFPSWSGGTAPDPTGERVQRLNTMLVENNPIAVGTQEMSPGWYTAFGSLDSSKWGWLTESDVAGYSYYNYVPNKGLALNSILYRKDLLTLNAHGVEAYTSRSNGQCIVWGVFTLGSNGKQFVLISTHWTPGADKANERLAQAEQLAKKVNDLRLIYGDTVICTGDFNCADDTQEFRRFLVYSNSIDSRPSAASRGDHLSKIDHVTATADGSFSYHTVLYEANNAYKISDHPFVIGDVKLSTNLYFDFTDTADSRAHYKQGAYRYNAYDYHTAYWKHDSSRVSGLTINKSEGTLSFNVSDKGNPYVYTDTGSAAELKSAYGLNFNTSEATHAYIRFRLTNASLINTASNPSLTLSAVNRSTGKTASVSKAFQISQANSGYITLYLDLTKNIGSLSKIDSIQFSFDNIKNGSVKLAYIYMGVNNYSPLNYGLFFDYSNTSWDQSRYGGASYGGYQFDKGNWTTAGYGTTKDFTLNNSAGTVAIKVKNTNELGPVFATAPSNGTYSWDTAGACLNYDPSRAEVMQIRFRLDGCQTVSGKNSRVLLMYGGMYNGSFDGNNYENVKEYTYTDGKYLILTMELSDLFRQADKITQIGVRFQYVSSSSGGTATIDYLYIGPKAALPTKHVFDHKVTKPTCTQQGYTSHTCRTCAYSYKDTYTNALNHSYANYYVSAPPTVGSTGILMGTCTACSANHNIAMPKLNKTDYTYSVVVAATCTQGGVDKYTWNDKTYGTFAINTNSFPTGHDYSVKVTQPTCTAQGYSTYTCSRCSDSYNGDYVNAKGHTEVIDKAVAATCTASGKTEGKHCSVCNTVLVKQETLAALGHSYSTQVTLPTCTAQGYSTHTCSRCSHSYADSYVNAKGHTEVIDKAVAPTCTAQGKTEGKHCSVCNTVLVKQQTVPPTGHSDSSDGNNRCDLCGQRIKDAVLRFRTISLEGNIAINYYMDLSETVAADPNAYMLFTMEDGSSVKVPARDAVGTMYQNDYYYVFSCAVTAKEMTDTVICQFFYQGGQTEAYAYSVKTYADRILASNSSAKLRDLIYAMLNYGAASQIHFEYHTECLANAGQELPDYTAVTIEGFPVNTEQGTTLATYAGASLLLTSETTLRLFFNVDDSVADRFTVTYKGESLPLNIRSGRYYVDIPNISAKDLDEYFTLVIFDGTETAEVSYSPLSYCASVIKNANGIHDRKLQDVAAAMYLYNLAANAYFAN